VITEALKQRAHDANVASGAFDFEQEGSLATFWRQATPGTTYWRGYLPMKALPGQVRMLGPDSLALSDDGVLTLHGNEGTSIWQFLGDDGRSRVALQLRRQGVRTLMEVDDNYLRYAPPLYGKYGAWTKTHKEAVANGTGYSVEMHRVVVPQMDGIIVATEQLANEYAEWNDHVYHCPNSVDPGDWDVERAPSEKLRIGYYGSPSHAKDWPLVKKAMKRLARNPDVEIVLAGFSPAGWTGTILPWADDLFAARQNIGRIDVGIAPLVENRWSLGKSDVKALEYAMGGAMPILQDAAPYSPWKNAGWEWMAKTEQDWYDLLHEIVANRDLVPTLAQAAKDYVLANRTIEQNIHHWREAVLDGA
jgi:hypothetical protein